MSRLLPDFMKSPYYDLENYKIKDDAPEDVKKELQRQLDEWNKEYDDAYKAGIML